MSQKQLSRGLVFSTVYYPYASGAEIAIKEIADRLPDYTWDLITARLDKSLPTEETVGSVRIHRVGFGFKTLDKFLLPVTGFFKAASLHRKKPYNLLWSMMASQGSIPAALMKMWDSSLRLVLTLQEGDEEEYLTRYVGGNQFLYKLLIRPWHYLVFKKADCITVLSEHLAGRARRVNPTVPIVIVPNGVDFSVFHKVSPPTTGPTVLITTSRLVEKNDPESVIRALSLLPDSVHFWILGQGVLEKHLKELVQKLKLNDRVRFLGQVGHSEIAQLFKEAHIFIRPALSEGLGSSFLEAMAAGLPIIATPVGGIPDFLKDEETGLFCEVKNPESIARAVKRLIEDPQLYTHVRETGYSFARSRYDWKSVAHDMKEKAFQISGSQHSVLIAAAIYPPDPGGPATHARQAFENLPKQGVKTSLVTFREVRHLPFGIRHGVYFWKLLMRARHVECIYAYDALSSGVAAVIAAKILNKKLIIRIGGDRVWEWAFEKGLTKDSLDVFYKKGEYSNYLLYRVTRSVLLSADVLVVPSEHTAELYKKFYGVSPHSIRVIPNPVSLDKQKSVWVGVPTLLFASRLVGYKNLPFIFRSLAQLSKDQKNFRFVVYGDGPEREYLSMLIKELNLGEFVSLKGSVSQEEVQKATRDAYLVLAPALTEFHPNYLLEGISRGKPFLITRGHALPFAVPELFLFDPENHEEFEKKLQFLFTPEGYAVAENEVSKLSFSYSWEENIKATSELVKTVCVS